METAGFLVIWFLIQFFGLSGLDWVGKRPIQTGINLAIATVSTIIIGFCYVIFNK